jgi:hypothetical protein
MNRRAVTPELLANQADVPTRTARRYLQKHFAARRQNDGVFALTECEVMETRAALRRLSGVMAVGFKATRN